MPIYEYVCTACGHDLEALRKISEEPLVYCPQCGEATLKKKVSAAAFRLKGTGWYETDFKNSGKKSGDKKDKKDKKSEKPSAGKSADSPGKKAAKSADKAKSGGSASKNNSAA